MHIKFLQRLIEERRIETRCYIYYLTDHIDYFTIDRFDKENKEYKQIDVVERGECWKWHGNAR